MVSADSLETTGTAKRRLTNMKRAKCYRSTQYESVQEDQCEREKGWGV